MKRMIQLALCVAFAFALLLFASQCSPLYPINVWDDANCLLTVGRVMRSGGVLYRDIYEQKGPTLYLIETLAAWISDTSFLGVYVMEALSLGAALFFACRMLEGRLGLSMSVGMSALLGGCIVVSRAFARGNSAEEFCLPLLMATLWLVSKSYEGGKPMPLGRLFFCGMLAGLVATIKYTILGLFIGLCALEGVAALREGGLSRALRSALAFLGGMLLPVFLWAVYFAANGALSDAYTAYLYNNIFLYRDESASLLELAKTLARAGLDNWTWALPAALGVALCALDGREHGMRRLGVLLMAGAALATVFFFGRMWAYCPLVLSVFGVYGLRALGGSLRLKGKRAAACGAALGALAVVMAFALSPNAYLRGKPIEKLAQGRLAEFLSPGDTLLQYNHLDDGLYLTTGALPQGKYFCRLNVDSKEMRDALDESLRAGEPDYVLSTWCVLPEEFDNYQLIATDAGYDDADRINKMFYLYRRR